MPPPPIRGSDAERLHARLKIDEKTGCHLWMGYRNTQGYGRMPVKHRGRQLTHRIAWEVTNGPIPKGMIVMHAVCDNPPCCNPEHLKLGTHLENARDQARKGRGPGARELDLKIHPQWARRPRRRKWTKHQPYLPQADQTPAPVLPAPSTDLRPGEIFSSGHTWKAGQVALWIVEFASRQERTLRPAPLAGIGMPDAE